MIQRIAVDAVPPNPWRNGHGVTRDILVAPGGPEDWSIGLADLERDAPFSCFPGLDRTFTLVAGGPVQFAFEDGATLHCPPLLPILFPGDRPLACRLIAGPARALNVMVDHARFIAQVCVLRLADGHRAGIPGGTTALYCAQGCVAAADVTMAAGEALLDGGGPLEVRAVAARDGPSTLVLVTVAAV